MNRWTWRVEWMRAVLEPVAIHLQRFDLMAKTLTWFISHSDRLQLAVVTFDPVCVYDLSVCPYNESNGSESQR